ncbi:hypothetical protein ASPZODRAFT_136914 [Penicilliopsis zonata CBS 506.65]|uniref:FAD/NAD(P)-binding domain-containing protein n=1 Tax=Penicilliopsis zonata CBS 506.65 TaxID=1073090 RepID=A0A1L9S6L8_9EURO|nr:hypothetical protein ASPZODRAFT_136914 [Penicilliopsis zonata CBS 506.65]OJJ42773.1 hypothetical protein ASPZODRAFT_136914 [Penicilliopsis zonata CBS 506.65]
MRAVARAAGKHRVVVVGAGSAGLAVSHQLLRSGRFLQNEIAIIDPAAWHHYQPGWTLVGAGLKDKTDLQRPLRELIDPKLRFYHERVESFTPDTNTLTLGNGDRVHYDQLVVVPGIRIDYTSIKGLPEALADPHMLVSSTYGYETCDKVYTSVKRLQKGTAIFTQPSGIVKCAGAPQKAMWLAMDFWRKAGLFPSAIDVHFATALPGMFGVPKYSQRLDELRRQRGVHGHFQHDLTEVNGDKAVFSTPEGTVTKRFDFLHVVPKMGPHGFIRDSPLANKASGLVDVDPATTRHLNYANVWSIGDASSLPTSKTAAAITSQAPVLVDNLLQAMDGKTPETVYDGYTSCPLITEYGKVMLAEFKYNGEIKETFSFLGLDQGTPRRAFYHLKKDFFPWVYYKSMVKGTWAGPKGWK